MLSKQLSQAVSLGVKLCRYFSMLIPSTRCHKRHGDIFEYSVSRKTEVWTDWCAHFLCFYISLSYIKCKILTLKSPN